MKGEFVVSSFCRGGACIVQVKHNSNYVVVGGKNNGGFPFGMLVKATAKLLLKEWEISFTLKHYTINKLRIWWFKKRLMKNIRNHQSLARRKQVEQILQEQN